MQLSRIVANGGRTRTLRMARGRFCYQEDEIVSRRAMRADQTAVVVIGFPGYFLADGVITY
jgi:hypothetical protein